MTMRSFLGGSAAGASAEARTRRAAPDRDGGAFGGRRRRARLACGVGLLAVAIAATMLAPARSSADAPWTDPVVLYSTSGGWVWEPRLIADPAGDVHLFFTSAESSRAQATTGGVGAAGLGGATDTMMYARLHDGHWSTPVDILTSPDGTTLVQPDVTLDAQGFLHVIWKGGAFGNLYYSHAHVAGAAEASRWSPPQRLSDSELAPGAFGAAAAIAAAPSGGLVVVYAAREGGIRYRRSDDGGQSWTSSVTAADGSGPGMLPDLPRIAVGTADRLHLTWTEYHLPEAWPPAGSFSTMSDDSGVTWAEPIRITGEKYGLVNMAVDQRNPGVIHRVWNSVVAIGERRHQWSVDGGQTWSQSKNTAPTLTGGGFTGYPAVAVDSADALNLATVGSEGYIGGPTGVMYQRWDGTRWTDPVFLSRGSQGKRSVEQPTLAVSGGNRLHVAWEDDSARIWYTTRLLDAPTLPAQSIPPPPAPRQIAAQPLPTSVAATDSTRVPRRLSPDDLHSDTEPALPLLAGAISTLIAVGALAISRAVRLI